MRPAGRQLTEHAALAREIQEMQLFLWESWPITRLTAPNKMVWDWLIRKSRGGRELLEVTGTMVAQCYGAQGDAGKHRLDALEEIGAIEVTKDGKDSTTGRWLIQVHDPRTVAKLRQIKCLAASGQAAFEFYLEAEPASADDTVAADQAHVLPAVKLSIAQGTSPAAGSTNPSPAEITMTPRVDGVQHPSDEGPDVHRTRRSSAPSDDRPDDRRTRRSSEAPSTSTSKEEDLNKTSPSLTSTSSQELRSEVRGRSAQPPLRRSSGPSSDPAASGPRPMAAVMLAVADALQGPDPDAQLVLQQQLVERINRTVNDGENLWADVPNRIAWAVVLGRVPEEELDGLLRTIARLHKRGFRAGPSQYFNAAAKAILRKHGATEALR